MNTYFGIRLSVLGLVFASSFGLPNFIPATLLKMPVARAAVVPSSSIKDTHQGQQKKNDVDLNREFELKTNQTARLKSEDLKIRFLRVTEDSRCPANARCITAGKVTIVVNIVKNNQDLGEFTLTSDPGQPDLAVQTFEGNSTITLVDVQPSRMTSEEIKPSDYRVTLIVSKS